MRRFWSFAVLLIGFAGCSKEAELSVTQEPLPRPVSVIKLRQSDPARSLAVTGVVGSWKTEDIGFEVSGRVEFVMEPEQLVRERSVADADQQPLARLDPERYESAVTSAEAQITTLEKQKDAARIEMVDVLKAKREIAVAEQTLAIEDEKRAKLALDAKAIPQSEYDKYKASLDASNAQVTQVDASKAAKSAEIAAIDAQINQAAIALKDAKLDLEDCKVYAPFRGQIAEVHVVRGATVQRGEPVLTVQAMDPMKVEFEVSAERAQQMHYKDILDVILTHPDGSTVREEAIVYMTDAVADPSTRTFTITLLVRNRQIPAAVPDDVDASALAKTRDLWKGISGLINESDDHFIAKDAIYSDDQGDYLWKVIETAEGRSPGPLFKVEKVRVTQVGEPVPYFGLWEFSNVVADDPSTFNITQDRVVGKIEQPDDKTDFAGDTVLFERKPWLLKPGDLAKVDLVDNQMPRGFYVPIDAIKEVSGESFVFEVVEEEVEVVDDNGEVEKRVLKKVQKLSVEPEDGPNTQKRITSNDPERPLTKDTKIVLGGVHYLVNGEAVNVAAEVEVN